MSAPDTTTGLPNIPGFRISEKIGDGGIGSVYKAEQLSMERNVAIKILSPQLAADPAYVEQFRREWKTSATHKHANIVQVYEVGEHEGVIYFVMEYVGGSNLEDLSRRGPMDPDQILGLAQSVAGALEYAWDKDQVSHGDLKPSNILIDTDGTVKVTDFLGTVGTGRVEASPSPLPAARDGDTYLPPEQTGRILAADVRADIYAMGAILYQLATGRSPQLSVDAGAQAQLEAPDSVNSSISQPLALMIERMMIRNPVYRPASWGEVLRDIAGVREGQVPSLLPPVGASAVQRSPRIAKVSAPRESRPEPVEGQTTTPIPAERAALAPEQAPSRRAKIVVTPTQGKKKLRVKAHSVPDPDAQPLPQVRRRRGLSIGRVIVAFFMLILFGAGAVLLWHLYQGRAQESTQEVLNATPSPKPGDLPFQIEEEEVEPGEPVEDPPQEPGFEQVAEALPEEGEEEFLEPGGEEMTAWQEVEAEAEKTSSTLTERTPEEFGEYLDLMRTLFSHAAKRDYAQGQKTISHWSARHSIHAYAGTVRDNRERLERVGTLAQKIEEASDALVGLEITGGRIRSVRNGSVNLSRETRNGSLTSSVYVTSLPEREFMQLLKAAAPEEALLNITAFLLSQGRFKNAQSLMARGRLPPDRIEFFNRWREDWQHALANIQARNALNSISSLIGSGKINEADGKMSLALQAFGETDVFTWSHREKVDRLNIEILDEQATASTPMEDERPGTRTEPDPLADATPVQSLGRPPKIDIDIQRSKNTRREGFDYDNETQNVSVRVRLTNKELTHALSGMTQHVFGFSRSTVHNDRFQLIIKESEAFGLTIGDTYEYNTKSVQLQYDDNMYARFGFKYYGWMILIKDDSGNVILSKSSKKRLLENVSLIEVTTEGSEIDM